MYKLLLGICIGAIITGVYGEYTHNTDNMYLEPEVIHKCTENEKRAAIVNQLVLAIEDERFVIDYAPKPQRKPR